MNTTDYPSGIRLSHRRQCLSHTTEVLAIVHRHRSNALRDSEVTFTRCLVAHSVCCGEYSNAQTTHRFGNLCPVNSIYCNSTELLLTGKGLA